MKKPKHKSGPSAPIPAKPHLQKANQKRREDARNTKIGKYIIDKMK